MNKIFFSENSLLAAFIVQNCKTILTEDLELWGCAIISPKWPIWPPTKCFGKKALIFFYLPIRSLHCAKFKKSSWGQSIVMRMCHFWVQNHPFAQTRNVFGKPVNEPCSFHWCLSTFQTSKSDINLLMKYWWSKNFKTLLAERHFRPQLKNQIFPRHAFFTEC